MDCSAEAGGKATRTIEFFPAALRSRPVSAWVTNGPIGGCQARHVGRSLTGLQGVGMLNTTILPEKPRNPERVLSVVDDRAAFEEKKRRQALALAQDQHLFADAIDVLHSADKYDYSYLWSWMGVPIIQLPADIITTQEVIWATKPDVIIETGVWHAAAQYCSWHRFWSSSARAR